MNKQKNFTSALISVLIISGLAYLILGTGLHGDDYIEVDVEQLDGDGNDAGLRYIVDKILQASADQYNGVTGTSSSNSSDDINTSAYNN